MKLKQVAQGLSILIALTASLSAAPILVDEWSGGSGDSTEKIAVRTAINEYNAANDPDLPQIFDNTMPPPGSEPNLLEGWFELDPGAVSDYSEDEGPNSVLNWTPSLSDAYCEYYIMTKWGAPSRAPFDHVLHYLVDGDSIVDYNPTGANSLSHLRIWGRECEPTVPDGGLTAVLLAMGLAACGFARRLFV